MQHHTQTTPRKRPLTASRTPVARIMTRDVVSVTPEMSLESVMSLFAEQGFVSAPVVDAEKRPIGMVSKTDLVVDRYQKGDTSEEAQEEEPILRSGRVAYPAGPGYHLHSTPGTVAEVMTEGALTIGESASVVDAAELMAIHRVHALPVVSAERTLVGLVSALDILSWLSRLR